MPVATKEPINHGWVRCVVSDAIESSGGPKSRWGVVRGKRSDHEAMTNPAAQVTTDRPELVIGLVGAVGTDLTLTAELLSEILRSFGYYVPEPVSLSGLLDHVKRETPLRRRDQGGYDTYVDERMTAGDELRENLRRGAALAQMAVHEIVLRRASMFRGQGGDPQPGNSAYILRSLKHKAEVEALRMVYGTRFVLVGAHSPRAKRTEALSSAIAKSYASTDRAKYKEDAERLAHRDEAEEDNDYGQNVRDTFPLADFFVDVSQRDEARRNLTRFLFAVFSWPYASPSRDEFAMFHAQAASARSADLSRQVGAAVSTAEGDIIAVGTNEVPRFGGGAYWEGDPDDARDFQQGGDANQWMRDVIIDEIRKVLSELVWFAEERKKSTLKEFRDALGDARVQQLTEFNRAVHAEMSALLDAARRGVSVRQATLYSTTFPCHNCAKHLVGAGIVRVVYIAPYAKSLAEELHPDTIAIDQENPIVDKVMFDPFVGVAPNLYLPLFEKGSLRRKDKESGKTVDFNPLAARPKLVPEGDFGYLEREHLVLRELRDALLESMQRATQGDERKVELSEDRMASLEQLRAQDLEEAEEQSARSHDEHGSDENEEQKGAE